MVTQWSNTFWHSLPQSVINTLGTGITIHSLVAQRGVSFVAPDICSFIPVTLYANAANLVFTFCPLKSKWNLKKKQYILFSSQTLLHLHFWLIHWNKRVFNLPRNKISNTPKLQSILQGLKDAILINCIISERNFSPPRPHWSLPTNNFENPGHSVHALVSQSLSRAW